MCKKYLMAYFLLQNSPRSVCCVDKLKPGIGRSLNDEKMGWPDDGHPACCVVGGLFAEGFHPSGDVGH